MKKCIVIVFLTIVIFGGLPRVLQANLNDGLIAYFPFNGDADDDSGNEHHGTEYADIEYVIGFSENAIKFNDSGVKTLTSYFDKDGAYYGTETIAYQHSIPNQSNPQTLSVWFKTSVANTSDWGGLIAGVSSYGKSRFYVSIKANYLMVGYGLGDYIMKELPDAIVNDNNWHNVVFVSHGNAGDKMVYVDGVLRSTFTEGTNIETTEGYYAFGGYWMHKGLYRNNFHGEVDEVRFYDRAFSESEIHELYERENETEDRYSEGYEAGKQYCIENPEECGISIGGGYDEGYNTAIAEVQENPSNYGLFGSCNENSRPSFTGELAENIQSYLVLTGNSVPFYLSPGSYVQAFGSDSMNTVNVEKYSRVQCKNFVGENEVNIEEVSSQFTVYRSGATVYLNSTSGTRVEIAAIETPQTLRFADGSLELAIIDGNVMLGSQLVGEAESTVESVVDDGDTSEEIF